MNKKTLHNEVMTRDNWECQACRNRDSDALQIDPATPRSLGGSDRLENLQALCGVCNNRKMQVDLLIEPAPMSDEVSRAWEIVNADMATRRESFDSQLEQARQDELVGLIERFKELTTKQKRINFLKPFGFAKREAIRNG